MLTYKNTNIVFLLLLLVLLVLIVWLQLPLFTLAILLLFYAGIVSYGSYFISSGFFLPAICSANVTSKTIALSFDDGPSENYTPAILDILQGYQIPVAFFCIGKRIRGNEPIINRILQNGHVIGNHSFSHHYLFDFFSRKKMACDLSEMDSTLQKASDLKPLLFRPPYGVTTPAMKKVLRDGGYTAIGWSIRSLDTVIKDETKLFDKVTTALKPGSIILFHDTSKTTVNVLQRIIEYALQNGYTFERLDKLINKQPYA